MTDTGANLTFVAPYSSEYPFIDRMKTSSPDWMVDSISYQHMDGDASLIQNGYYTKLPDGACEVGLAVEMDPPALATADQYVITWSGTGTFRFIGADVESTGDHTLTINFTGTSGTPTFDQLIFYLTSIDESNPIHDIHIVRADQVSLFNQGEIFNPDFVNKLSGLDDLRFMDWAATNTNQTVSWDDRTQVSDRTWFSQGSAAGVPLDVMVKLCNETHADMWYNVPTQANDDYVRHALQYIHDNLDPSLTLHVEYSNEVWNWGFQQSHYALTQGDKLFGTDVNGDGVINSDDPAEHVGDGWLQYYGYRTAQIATIADGVWTGGDRSRLDMIISGQTYNQTEYAVFDGVNKEVNGLQASSGTSAAAVASLFKDYAVAGYFGGFDGVMSDPAKEAQVVAWARSGAAGLDAAFDQIEHGGSVIDPAFSIDGVAQVYQQKGALARANGLNLVVYEGGLSADWTVFPGQDQPLIAQFVAQLRADPRMAALTAQNIANFEAAGGTLFNAYTDAGGVWGTMGTIYDQDNGVWDAYKNAASGGGGLHLIAGANGGLLTGAAGMDWLEGGKGADHLRGMAGADMLLGGANNDILDGGSGADRMTGGTGNDTYYVDNAGDRVIEQAGEGTDLVWSSIASWTLGPNVENLSFTGTMAHTGIGNELANTIQATSAADTLYGMAGDDVLKGMAGNDVLDGGAGADTMYGATGDDTYYVDNARDKVIEHGNQGVDQVIASLAAYTLPSNVENLSFTGAIDHVGTGNSLANTIIAASGDDILNGGGGADTLIGMAGDDVLNGGTGADRMSGGTGDDTYYVDNSHDAVIEQPGQGVDLVIASIARYALTDDVENLSFTGARDHIGVGNDLANTIRAASADDILSGGGGDDTIMGMAGDDVLDGGTGADRLYGSLGNDVLDGGAGNDWLSGGAGDDTIIGGTGQDILRGDSGADRFVFAPGDGATSASADRLKDFSHAQGDKIDLSAFEHSIGGAHDFHFIGAASFSGEAGELQVTKVGSSYLVGLDTDGDRHADFMLMVASAGHIAPTAADFIL